MSAKILRGFAPRFQWLLFCAPLCAALFSDMRESKARIAAHFSAFQFCFAAILIIAGCLLSACGGGGSSSSRDAPCMDCPPSGGEYVQRVSIPRQTAAAEYRVLQITENAALQSAFAIGAQDSATTITIAVIPAGDARVDGGNIVYDIKIGENGDYTYIIVAVDGSNAVIAQVRVSISVTNLIEDRVLNVSREVLPDYANAFLQDDSSIRLAASGNPADGTTAQRFDEVNEDRFRHLPYTGADYINAESTTDLASHWWLLPYDIDIVALNSHDTGEVVDDYGDAEYTQITVGILYRAGGDKMVVPILDDGNRGGGSGCVGAPGTSILTCPPPALVTAVLAITLSHQGQAPLVSVFGGGDYGITLADYDDQITPEIYSVVFFNDPDFAVGDDYDYLAFQNQYSMFGVWMLPSINEPNYGEAFFGLQTPLARIPNSGTATYRGIAAGSLVNNSEEDAPDYFVYGTSEFTADFANAQVDGKITVSAFDYSHTENVLEERGGALNNPRGTIGMEFNNAEISDGEFATDGSTSSLSYSADNIAADLGVFAPFKKDGANEFADDAYSDAEGRFFGFNADEIAGDIDIELDDVDDGYWLAIGFTADKQ